jgi:toxin-antitoxin system PIN domain toxin
LSVTLDANVLLYASDDESPLRDRARKLLEQVASGPQIVYLFWPTVMAYLRIATHPAVFRRPLSIVEAASNVSQLLDRPHVRTAGEGEAFWRTFATVVDDGLPAGNLVPDAHLVALMAENDVRTILTRDRDYRRFRQIEARDPFR